jgi:hypothetical protein
MTEALSTTVASDQERETLELMAKANDIAELLQRAIKLGFTISMAPEQMQTVIDIFEGAQLIKVKHGDRS